MRALIRVMLWLWVIAVGILFAPSPTHATDFLNVTYHHCYDGDTCTVTIPNVHPLFGEKIRVRINGVDAPEKGWRAKCDPEKDLAIKAHNLAHSMMESASRIDLRNAKRDTKFFRVAADVVVDGVSIGERLLECGLAHPYDGKQKRSWCK